MRDWSSDVCSSDLSILTQVLNKSKDKILIIISHDEAVQKFLSGNTDLKILKIGSE